MNVIAADVADTMHRMHSDAERLGKLAERMKHSLASAADRAVDVGAKAFSEALEAAAARANRMLDESLGDILGDLFGKSDTSSPRKAPERKQLKP
jgi:hypothetical protein